jgi:TIGR03009 family protein
MRVYRLALVGWLLAGALACAQQAQPGVPPAANPGRLDSLLNSWEQKMQSVQSLSAECKRTTVDKAFKSTDIFEGKALYLAPDRAALHMIKQGKPDVYERFLCTGTFLYEFVPANKIVRVHELPPRKPGQVADNNFLSFLFGMKAEEAKRRYDLRLAQEDQHWVYIDIYPRLAEDKADFQRARLVLSAATFLPRQLWFVQPNLNEVTWDIPRVDTTTPLNIKEFAVPALPGGWKMVQVPRTDSQPQQPGKADPPPRIVRPKQP